MLKIRLQRVGKRHQPFYRIVAADSRTAQSAKVREVLGTYNPRVEGRLGKVTLNRERVQYWLGCGAQVTDTVASILQAQNLLPPGGKRARVKG